jgi:hypothetical protein
VDNGVTRRLGGDKPRHYIFDQDYRPEKMSGFSGAADRERPVKLRKKLMNVEHRIMCSACRELLCRTVRFKNDFAISTAHSLQSV